MERKSWDEYFFDLAKLVSTRATCSRAQVGCVLVKDKRIIATGYNGALAGRKHCNHGNQDMLWIHGSPPPPEYLAKKDLYMIDGITHCLIAVHAELNAVADCARRGISCDGATMYITKKPCDNCLKLIYSSGIFDIKVCE